MPFYFNQGKRNKFISYTKCRIDPNLLFSFYYVNVAEPEGLIIICKALNFSNLSKDTVLHEKGNYVPFK